MQHLDLLYLWYDVAICLYLPLDISEGPARVFVQTYSKCFLLQGSDANISHSKGRL